MITEPPAKRTTPTDTPGTRKGSAKRLRARVETSGVIAEVLREDSSASPSFKRLGVAKEEEKARIMADALLNNRMFVNERI